MVGLRTQSSVGAPGAIDLAGLYTSQHLSMIRLAVLLVDDVATAEDVVQDAFVGLARATRRLEDQSAATRYLRASVVNGARSALRRRRTVRGFLSRASHPDPAPPADAAVLSAEDRDEVLDAVRLLPTRMREVLVLRYWSELSVAQTAEALSITEGAVKSTASRALDRLETMLGGSR